MPIHELIQRLLSGGAYYAPEGGAAAAAAASVRTEEDDDEGDEAPDSEEPIADLRAAKRRLAEYEKYVTKLRRENANYRGKSKAAKDEKEAADKALKDANAAHEKAMNDLKVEHANAIKTAVDTAKAEFSTQTKQEKITAALKTEAQKIGAKDVDDLLKIIDASGITVDDKGNVVGVEKLLGDTKTAKPHLFGAASTSSTAAAPATSAAEGTDLMKMHDKAAASEFAKLGIRF